MLKFPKRNQSKQFIQNTKSKVQTQNEHKYEPKQEHEHKVNIHMNMDININLQLLNKIEVINFKKKKQNKTHQTKPILNFIKKTNQRVYT